MIQLPKQSKSYRETHGLLFTSGFGGLAKNLTLREMTAGFASHPTYGSRGAPLIPMHLCGFALLFQALTLAQ